MRVWCWMLWLWPWAAFAQAGESPAPVPGAYRDADPAMLAEVRRRFDLAADSATATRELGEWLDQRLPAEFQAWPPIFLAYRAALDGLAGKHSLRPWEKYRGVQRGLAKFKGLAEAHPDSIEIRLLRYSFCSQLPGFFGIAPQAERDLAALIRLLEAQRDPGVSAEYAQAAARWILEHGQPSPAERRRLEALLPPRE